MKLRNLILLASAFAVATSASAQAYKDGYVSQGGGSEKWTSQLTQWGTNGYVNDDDNFFISRVKPHARFRNTATQVRQNIDETNDKHLVAWVPVNNVLNNALPDGVFDSECFTMWSYVTHWGNWTAPIGRIPGGFLDVAHKNGVPVSGVASVPYGSLTGSTWEKELANYSKADPELAARFFRYYGIDGMGYNSEFAGGQSFIKNLRTFHANLVKAARKDNPLFENIWYDGTNDNSIISFDRGLGTHNQQTFGDKDNIRTSLFFNYNWNRESLLSSSVDYARNTLGRDPLDLYAGVNMQGNEPATNNWPLLKNYPISIGLWGAHSNNMFWESRGEKGSDPAVQQDSYYKRIERWFTGGTRNPANCPDIIVSNKYNVENYKFHGMSSMMTARSPLCWDLAEEPFITYFNVGNGKFFNFEGQRQHNGEWYNISAQDYQPTWHYWFATRLLGNTAADVPATGLDAQYTWDDAWFGGSTVKITGNTDSEYLHLFKTEYALKRGDVITFRYKLNKGQGNVNLVLTAKGAEAKAINETDFNVMTPALLADEDVWETRSFTVGDELDGKDLALVALHFEGARGLEMVLGEFSIVRGTSATPATPVLAKAQTLSYNRGGIDAKLIWNMPNDKAKGEPVYNLDVNTSYFKVYAQQEGSEPVFMGVSTSWADLIYNVPVDLNADVMKVRYGVSAVSTDHKSESPIAWSDYETVGDYAYSEDVQIDKTVIKPSEDFTIGYVDPKHNVATWKIMSGDNVLYTAKNVHEFTVSEGLPEIGSYDLVVEEPVGDVPVVDIDPTSYSIQLYGTKLYLSTDEYDDNGKATCSLSATPEYYEITPSGSGYIIKSKSSGKYVGHKSSVSTWDTADSPDVWTINNIEGEPTFIYKNATQGLGTDAKEAGKGVYTDKTGVQWIVAHPEENAGETPAFTTRTFASFVQVSGESVGALPKIYTFTANNEEADITVEKDEEVTLRYTGRAADGAGSQGVDLQEARFGATAADLGVVGQKSFSVGFWIKINELASGETQLFSVANKLDSWPKTDWGWIWCNIMDDGNIGSFTFRGTDATSNNELKYAFGDTKIPVGNWVHIGFAFDYNASGWFKTHFFINGKEQQVTSVSRTNAIAGSPDKDGYHKNVYSITNGQVMAIGGSAHGRSGIKGTVDNVIVWDGVANEAMMQAAMGDIDAKNLDKNVLAYWDLDSEQGDDYTFTSVGQKQIAAGCHSYEAAGGEGQGVFHWTKSEYTSGCPFVKGTAFPVVTLPEWRYKKALMTEAEGNNGEQGEAKIAWKQGGDYSVTLTLKNSLGSDSKTFSVITVKDEEIVGINAASTAEARAYAVDGQAFLTFSEAGDYTVQVYNAAGQLVATKAAAITGAEHMAVRLGQQGTYVVRVVRNGEELRSIKLLNK